MSPLLGPLTIVLALVLPVNNVALVLLLVLVIGLAFTVPFAAVLPAHAELAFDELLLGLLVGRILQGIDLS